MIGTGRASRVRARAASARVRARTAQAESGPRERARRERGRPGRCQRGIASWFPARRTTLTLVAVAMCAAPHGTARADPPTDYMLQCRGCHGPDGAGAPGAAPSFRGQLGRFLTVPGGREYLIRVPGTAQSELDDARTAALLNWLVREFSPDEVPPNFVPYTPDEVGRGRRAPLIDVWAARRALTDAIAARAAQPTDGASESRRTGQ